MMKLKYIMISLIWIGMMLHPLYAQEEPPPEEEAQEASGGGGGASSSGFQIGIGSLYTYIISETTETQAAKKNEFFPQLSFLFNTGSFAIGVEVLLDTTFTVHADGNISLTEIADSDIIFSGRTVSEMIKFGEDLSVYLGYGINEFSASQSLSKSTIRKARTEYLFSQRTIASRGDQWILGGEMNLFEELHFALDYRLMTIPVEAKTSLTPLDTGETSKKNPRFDLTFTIISVGVAYYF